MTLSLRRLVRIVLALLGAVSVLAGIAVATASPADAAVAAFGDCKEPPMPANPMGNPLAPGEPYNASERDPFKKGSDVTIAQVYGNGYTWFAYDNGCGPGDDIMPNIGTGIANLGLEFSSTWVAWGRTFQTSVLTPDNWIGKIDPTVEKATKQVADGFWFPWLPVALTVVAAMALFRSRDGQVAQVVTGLGWSFVVMILVSWVVSYPAEAPRLLDKGIATATTQIANAFSEEKQSNPKPAITPGEEKRIARGGEAAQEDKGAAALFAMQQQWDEIDRSTSYHTWLAGVFGDPNSKTAKKYGPEIFKATHFTWKEADTYQSDPTGKGKKIVERKQELFEKTADKIKEEDPRAYDYLTGNRWMERIVSSMTGGLITLITVAFLFLASIGMAAAYVVIRLIVPFAPAAGPIFMIDSFRNVVQDKAKRAAALLVMGPIYLVVGLVVLRVNTATLGSGLPLIWQVFIIALVAWLAWKLTKPTALGGHSLGVGRMMQRAAATAAGVRLGNRGKKGSGDDKDEDDDPEERESAPYRRSFPKDRPVHESRELPPGSPPREDSHDLGEIPNESQPVSEGVFVPRTRQEGLPSRREALALPAGTSVGASPSREENQSVPEPNASAPAGDGRVRPFATEPTAPDEDPTEHEHVEGDIPGPDRAELVDVDPPTAGRAQPRPGVEPGRSGFTGDSRFTALYAGEGTSTRDRLSLGEHDTGSEGDSAVDRDGLVDADAGDGGDRTAAVFPPPVGPSPARGPSAGVDGTRSEDETSAGGSSSPSETTPLPTERPTAEDHRSSDDVRVMGQGEPIPPGTHEANYTYDTDGQPVFSIYRPESMKRRETDG